MEDFEVSKKSWHFRMNTFCYGEKPYGTTSLCKYFWKTVFGPIKLTVLWLCIAAVTIVGGLTLGFGAFYLVGLIFAIMLNTIHIIPDGIFNFSRGVFDWKFIPTSILVDCVVLYSVFIFNNPKKALKWFYKNKPMKDTPKKQSLFIEFIKAKKRKICPLITFKD